MFTTGLYYALELPAPDPRDQTQAEMGRVGAAMVAWLADQAVVPGACEDIVDLITYPQVPWSVVQAQLVPGYLSEVPQRDAWGHNYSYFLNDSSPPEPLIAIRSPGADGSFSGLTHPRGVVTDPDEDLVWTDGYFVRWAVPTRNASSQRATVEETRTIGAAMVSYLTDIIGRHEAAPSSQPGESGNLEEEGQPGEIDLVIYHGVSHSSLKALLVPDYLACLPQLDGWGNNYSFYLLENPQPGDSELAAIRSSGSDSAFTGTTYVIGSFLAGEVEEDIVWADGFFAQWPRSISDAPEIAAGSVAPVNASAVGDQTHPAIAVPSRNARLAFWAAPAADGRGIVARLLDANGAAIGAELAVETRTVGEQQDPAAAAGGGQVVVAWQTAAGGAPEIAAQRFDAQGQPLGGEIAVSLSAASTNAHPAVAVAPDGSFLVAWTAPASASEGSDEQIRVRAFTPQGFAAGADQPAHPASTGARGPAQVAAGLDGNFLVAWEDDDGAGRGILGRLINSTGTALANVTRLHQHSAGDQRSPALAGDRTGRYAVAWFEEEGAPGADGTILARRLAPDLTPIGQASYVGFAAAPTEGAGFTPAIALAFDDLGALLASWSTAAPASGIPAILARHFDSAGLPQGEEIILASDTALVPALATGPNADFLTLWQAPDTDGQGIFARRVGQRVFLDGFEGGDVGAWVE